MSRTPVLQRGRGITSGTSFGDCFNKHYEMQGEASAICDSFTSV